MSGRQITPEVFRMFVGRPPEGDELERVNCDTVGVSGHFHCGWCGDCMLPRFHCGHENEAHLKQSLPYRRQ